MCTGIGEVPPSPGGMHGAGTTGGSKLRAVCAPGAAVPAGISSWTVPGAARAIPAPPLLSFSAWKSISPVLPHPMGPGCARREFRDRCGTCWHWVLGFPLVCQDFVFLLFFWKTRLASNLAATSVCDRLHSQHCLPCAGSCSLPWMYPVDPFGILFWHHSCSHIFPP